MADETRPGHPASLPEDIARRAGLPRQEGLGHSLHDPALDRAAGDSGAQGPGFGSPAGLDPDAVRGFGASPEASEATRVGASAEAAARGATETADDLKGRVSEAAETVRARAGEAVDRVRARAGDAYEDARDWASERYDRHSRRATDLADRGYVRLRDGRNATEAFVGDNPLLVGVVGIAAGLLLGALLPGTRREKEALGPWADEVRDQGLRYAREFTDRGRTFVETALDPDNIDRAARRAGFAPEDAGEQDAHEEPRRGARADGRPAGAGYEGPERTAHRL